MPTLFALRSDNAYFLWDQGPNWTPTSVIEVVDVEHAQLVAAIDVDHFVSAFAVSGSTQRLYLCDRTAQAIEVRDTTGAVISQIPLPYKPRDCQLAHGGRNLFVTMDGGIALIDLVTAAVQTLLPDVPSFYWDDLDASPGGSVVLARGTSSGFDGGVMGVAAFLKAADGALISMVDLGAPSQYTNIGGCAIALAPTPARAIALPEGGAYAVVARADGSQETWDYGGSSDYGSTVGSIYVHRMCHVADVGRTYLPASVWKAPNHESGVWVLDDLAHAATLLTAFDGDPGVVTEGLPGSHEVYVAVRFSEEDYDGAGAEWIARIDTTTDEITATGASFVAEDRGTVQMEVVAEEVFDPPQTGAPSLGRPDQWREVAQVLWGITGGGGGVRITPGGGIIVEPTPPPDWWFSVERAQRIVRAAEVAARSMRLRDPRLRDAVGAAAQRAIERAVAPPPARGTRPPRGSTSA